MKAAVLSVSLPDRARGSGASESFAEEEDEPVDNEDGRRTARDASDDTASGSGSDDRPGDAPGGFGSGYSGKRQASLEYNEGKGVGGTGRK